MFFFVSLLHFSFFCVVLVFFARVFLCCVRVEQVASGLLSLCACVPVRGSVRVCL